MWQTIVVLLVIAAVLVYVVRHYVKVLRGDSNSCSHCTGCCPSTNGLCDQEAEPGSAGKN